MNVGGTPGEENGPSTAIEIAPELDVNTIPPEQRQYGFSIKNGSYEQLIKGFAHQTGLGVLGEAPRDGTVTFETTETLSFREALGRIRMLLFNYKPHEPYWILYKGTHLRVIRVTDFYRDIGLELMYRNVDEFKAANLSDDELALVIFTPSSGSIADLRQLRDFLPDYVRITPLEAGNSVTIFALVRDINKYLDLMRFFPPSGDDPRAIERFEVQFISATEAVNRLRMLADLDGGGRAAVPTGRRGASAQPNPLDQMSEPTISIIPDDGQGFILVRAMKDKIEEIRKLLPYVDVDMSVGEFKPVVIPIEHAEAAELVTAIQQVLSASVAPVAPAGQPAAPKSPRKGRRGAAGAGGGGPVAADSVTMIPHPSKNAIVVLGDEAGIAKVRDLVSLFDVSSVLGPIRIQLEVADASEVVNTVTQVLGPGGAKGQPGPGMDHFQLVPDPSGTAIWYSGSERDLAKVHDVVAALDVAEEPVSLRVVRLTYLLPSFVTGILREIDGSTTASPTPAPATRVPKTKRVTTQAVSKFTPDDGQKLLYILCSDADWHRYEALIAQIDQPVANQEPFVRLTVKHIDPGTGVERLGSVLGSAGNVDASIHMLATDDSILLIGATPTDVARIKVFLAEIDKPSIVEQRTFEIHHADPADIKTAIETLLGGGSSEPRAVSRRRIPKVDAAGKAAVPVTADATGSEEMTVLQMGNRLVVKASPQRLDEVAAIIAEFDVETRETEMKVYADFPPGSDIIGISETLISVFGGGSRSPRAVVKDGASAGPALSGPRFIPQPASARLVVMAERTQFAEIEKLLSVLRVEASAEPSIVEFVEVKYGDPIELVEDIKPLLDMKIRGLVESGELSEAPTEGTTPTTVPRPGRVKALQKGGSSGRYHIAADARNERIVLAAPRAIVDEAKRLIEMFDQPARKKDKIVFRTVELANASPAEMVKAVKEMMGRPSARRPAVRGKPAVAGGAPGAAAPEGLSTENLTIFEAPGGGAIVLNGTMAEVEQATEWIKQLDAMSTRGRSIKLYEVKGADIAHVFDLIVHVVDSAAPAATGAGRSVRPPMPGKGTKEERIEDKEEFATTKTHSGADLYIQADLIGKTMLVATTPSKMAQIDDIVKMFETDKVLQEGIEEKFVPKFVYELEHADASDAKWDLQDLLESLWEPRGKLPKVEKLFKDSLVVRYPDESRFDEIKKLIRDHIDKPSDKKAKRVKKSFVPPPGMSAEEAAAWLKMNHPEYTIELLDISSDEDAKTFDIEVLKPTGSAASVSPCVLPAGFAKEALAILAGALIQTPPEEDQQEPQEEPPVESVSDEEPIMEQPVAPQPADLSDTLIRQVLTPLLKENQKKKSDDKEESKGRSDGRKSKEAKKLKVYYDKNKGVFVVEGEEEDIEEVNDWLDDLKDEIDKFPVKPDIRIVRVRYIDVYTAQDIIEEMFNATKSQQAMFNVQQQQQQQAQRLQQMQQQRMQQQQQPQQPQRGQQPGQDGKGGPQGQQPQVPQPQMQVPQLPAPAVRVYPNPRDRSLILRAETSQYPQILELLATVDQPKPVDSVMRTFQLKKLNAVEVEQMLREALHLDDAKSRPKAARAPTAPGMTGASQGPSTGPGGQLPQTVLQESTTGKLLGVDPQDITLFSSETANAIMVMAPPAALDYIGKLIEQFESGDLAERETRYYEIKYASVADVAEQLTNYFNEKSPGGAGRGARKAASGSAPGPASGGGGLNAPSFISYDRLNLLTVQATEEQFKEIEEVLARLDVKSEEDDWKDVVLAHADAKQVADTLSEMFGGGGSTMGGGPRGPASGAASGASKGGAGAKFIGEAGGRIVLYSAPKALHDQILTTVAKLEAQSEQTTRPRIIELKNATPSQVADALEKAYDSKRTGPKGATAAPRFTVTAHDPSHRLFVVADDEMFAQVESLAKTLDTPGVGLGGVEFRIYPLQYASAKAVHGQMTKLMQEYATRLGPQDKGKQLEAFSVQPDETANALIVLGTPSVFGFIEENLRKIDTPASAATQQQVHVVEVKNADPDALVKALSEIFVRTATKTQEGDVPISISAAAGSKAILVKCNAVDFAKIEATIKELDTQEVATAGDVRVVTLQYGDATEVNTALQEYLKKPGGQGGRGGQLIGDVRLGVLGQTNAIMVSGDKEQLDRIEAIVHGMDIAGEKGSVPQIIPLKYASASMVLPALKEMFSDPKMGGGKKHYYPPVIVADEMGNNVIVRGSPTDLAAIQGVIEKLDTEDKKDLTTFRIVQVAPGVNVEDLADKVEQSINESVKLRGGAGGARSGQMPTILALADKRTNSITLSGGNASLFDQAESMIRALEKMNTPGNQVTVIVPMTNVATEDIQRLIDQMTQQQSGSAGRRGSSGGGGSRPPRRNPGQP
ncbi:MAG: secretin N-terminal domain-containing protein [Phycisphaerales bacterium]|nr:secretin N-terminal domain-containing protein [Phycisphaerales bacterium]